jgi:hypothetical protein
VLWEVLWDEVLWIEARRQRGFGVRDCDPVGGRFRERVR